MGNTTVQVLNAVQVDADAYVAIADPAGTFAVGSVRCRIENVMPTPEDCGAGWKLALLAGRIGHTRWQVRASGGAVSDGTGPSKRDTRAVHALGAAIVGDPWL